MKLLILSLILISHTFASTYKVDDGHITFVAKGFPSFIKITGVSKQLKGSLLEDKGMLSGKLTLDPASLKTGMDLRDEHMTQNYLQVKEFSSIDLTLKPFKPSASGTVKATLKLHGQEKPVDVNYTYAKEANMLNVKADFKINIVDYAIAIPSFQGITVAKEVSLTADLQAKSSK